MNGRHPVPIVESGYSHGEWNEEDGFWEKVPYKITPNGAMIMWLPGLANSSTMRNFKEGTKQLTAYQRMRQAHRKRP